MNHFWEGLKIDTSKFVFFVRKIERVSKDFIGRMP
jgi:hypothetical protein